MRIHLIAIGGSAMHNLALALHYNHHTVSGSDDEIYNPARDRLAAQGLLPGEMGWHPKRITNSLDLIILGMHARKDNPELLRAQELNIPIYSYPEFLYQHAKDKKRLVVAGSHGKTSTTAMIMHVLKYHKVDFDYLVGAQLEGFETMVRLSDAPLMVIEGDEYLSSPIDRRPKIHHYFPQVAILTGIAWDHINVFPSFEEYVRQFEIFLEKMPEGGVLIYYKHDKEVSTISEAGNFRRIPYEAIASTTGGGETKIISSSGDEVPIQIFGKHNLENLQAALLACKEAGLTEEMFMEAIVRFKGAAKRLQSLYSGPDCSVFLDFAHAPSKVKATTEAVKSQYKERPLFAFFELHTFSSLNKEFIGEYADSLSAADHAYVYYNKHTMEMKKMPPLDKKEVEIAFSHQNLIVLDENDDLSALIREVQWSNKTGLFMSSGTFGGLDLKGLFKSGQVH